MNDLRHDVLQVIRDVPDFPKPGILFKDITPLIARPGLFTRTVVAMLGAHRGRGITHVVAIESRGFIFGAPVALGLEAAFVPVRKPGKLPARTAGIEYALEYGTDRLEIHADAFGDGPARVLVVDDVLATGGTAAATCTLVESLGAEVVGCSFVLELGFLAGRERFAGRPVESIVTV